VSLPERVPPRGLAITRRALKDLALTSAAYIGADPVDMVSDHVLVNAFVTQRSQDAIGQEPTLGIKPTTWNLHAGRWRAITWFDTASGICWLLAANQQHDYAEFVRRGEGGTLFPTSTDRADLELRASAAFEGAFWAVAVEDALELLDESDATENVEVQGVLADELEVSLYREVSADGILVSVYVTCRLPPRGNRPFDEDLAAVLAELLLDDTVNVDWWCNHHLRDQRACPATSRSCCGCRPRVRITVPPRSRRRCASTGSGKLG
jgi:hypothetical protein